MNVIKRGLVATALSALALAAACSDDNNNGGGGGPSTTWIGIFQADNGTDFGSVGVNAATDAPTPPAVRGQPLSVRAPVTATVDYNQTDAVAVNLTLTGTYDPALLASQLAVADQSYTFDGSFDGTSRMEGTWSGPGPIQGVFVSLMDDGAGRAFCGTYTGATGSGVVAFVVVNGVLAGNSYASGSTTPDAVDGTVAGTTVAFTSGTATGAGTITGTSAAGTVDAGGGVTFTWAATECTP